MKLSQRSRATAENPIADPRDLIRASPMSAAQKRIIALTALISALDGFDILSITFVAPVLGHVFNIGSGELGLLLSSGLLGAVVGSLTLAALADVIGRRPVVLISLVVMGLGMLASAFCTSLISLAIVRVLTGIGIGAMVVVINPIAVEFANMRSRSFAIAMMTIGYPLGGMVGGLMAALLLEFFDWRAVFLFGALMALLLYPLVVWKLPESLSYLIERQDETSLKRVNRLLVRFGHTPFDALPPPVARQTTPYREIFRGAQLPITAFVSAISVLVFLAIYFYLSWQPKLLVEMGFGASTAATIASTSSLAGACGTALFGILSRRYSGLKLAVLSIGSLGLSILLFGITPPVWPLIVVVAMLAGASVATATLGLYVTAADAFPAAIRSTGTGFMIGMGRIGSALAPSIAGVLFDLGLARAGVCMAIATCAVIASLLLWRAPRRASRMSAGDHS
jgi:benzoate transport